MIKVVWGSKWDELLQRDVDGVLLNKMNTTVDGQFQRYAVEDGAYARDDFFGPDPRLRKLVEHLSDDDIRNLPRGGHDYKKLYAAYKAATETEGRPTVILAKTVKGWTLGEGVEGRNATHQIKKMTLTQLRSLRDRLYLQEEVPENSLTDDAEPPYITLQPGTPEHEYFHARTKALDGGLPSRPVPIRKALTLPSDDVYTELLAGSGTAGGRHDDGLHPPAAQPGPRRGLRARVSCPSFPTRPARSAWTRCSARSRSTHRRASSTSRSTTTCCSPTPRARTARSSRRASPRPGRWPASSPPAPPTPTAACRWCRSSSSTRCSGSSGSATSIWAAADARARGFLLGATAGRTTLTGEGLQHQDGHSLLLASTVPTVEAYDPAFAFEVALIVRAGLDRMYGAGHPRRPARRHLLPHALQRDLPHAGHARRRRRATTSSSASSRACTAGPRRPRVRPSEPRILFSGTAYGAAAAARDELAERWDVACDLWSVTSYKKLREQAMVAERWNRLHPGDEPRTPMVFDRLNPSERPRRRPRSSRSPTTCAPCPTRSSRWVGRPYTSLGTDGFGRSDTREALRGFFEVDAGHVVVAVLSALADAGRGRSPRSSPRPSPPTASTPRSPHPGPD